MDDVVVITDSSSFDFGWIVQKSRLVIDTRNATGKVADNMNKVVKA
jgi:UDP-N-acetyl-D-mannosaminuronate dehydrogenase